MKIHGKRLNGIGFKIYSKVGDKKGWLKINESTGNIIGWTTFDDATEWKTITNGVTNVMNELPLGYYDIYEVNLGADPEINEIYELDDNCYVPTKDGTGNIKKKAKKVKENVKLENAETVLTTTKNKQIYVKLSGYTWLDWWEGKETTRNNLYDSTDKLLSGVKVSLKYKSDNTIVKDKTGTDFSMNTRSDGSYSFSKVLADQVAAGNYYIEFKYDGLTYQNVDPTLDQDNGSKAKEKSTDRATFNKNFSVIEGGENTVGNKKAIFGYTKDADGNKKNNLTYTISNHKATFNNRGMYKIEADTTSAGYYLKNKFTYGNKTTAKVTEIKNINLGLYKREQPDIAIVQDIENVKVNINGQSHIYNYASRFKNETTKKDEFDAYIRFEEKYGTQEYSRPVYEADYKYHDTNDSKNDLNVYVTYKITIKNESTNLKAVIYGLEDYFSSNYEISKVGSKIENGEISGINNKIKCDEASKYNDNYKKTTISTVDSKGVSILRGQSTDIYIQFKLDRKAVEELATKENKLSNIVEIHSYSIQDMNGNIYAGIDKDSNPNNCTPGTTDTYEDDTDAAPGLKITKATPRTVTGTVFLDYTDGELKSGEIREGDGEYKTSEDKGISGINVRMLKVSENGIGTMGRAQVYDTESDKFINAEATTDADGNYTISGYIPGLYQILFIWGDKIYKVQDYKGTIYQESEKREKNLEWYTYNPNFRYSDALDDCDKRIKIDEQTQVMTYDVKAKIEEYDKEKLITEMSSKTPNFRVNVEYAQGNSDGTQKETEHKITDIDFGIVERARQVVELDKRISHVKLTLPNQAIIIDTDIDENGNPVSTKNIGPSKDDGLLIQIDQEMIQGSTLELEYEFKLTNTSEIDYNDENFYLYGTIPANDNDIVTLTPNSIIDYLGNKVSSTASKNEGWDIVYGKDGIEDLKKQGLLSEDAAEAAKSDSTRTVLKLNNMNTKLKPGSSGNFTTAKLICSKLLATNDEEIVENHGEIIKITKSGGATIQTTPGNYVPNSISKTDEGEEYNPTSEVDNSNSGDVQVAIHTGLATDYIAYTILAISSLGILVLGIILIKKYVL